jgi:DNA-binding response OmpR family regulator
VLSAVAERSEEVTAVVLDVGLPGYTGVECLARLRATLPMLPCVLTTGGARPSLSGDLVEHTAFLAKPFSIDDLLVTVDALVDIRRAGV